MQLDVPMGNAKLFPALTAHTGPLQVYSTLNLTDYGSEGMTRVMESCCQECMGMGIINRMDPLVMTPPLEPTSANSILGTTRTEGLTMGWITCRVQAAKAGGGASRCGESVEDRSGAGRGDRKKPQEFKRLDQDDPPMDMDAILAKAGPCPFESRRKK